MTRGVTETKFGAGSLESITLRRRVVKGVVPEARVEGYFRIYCGAGNEHHQRIRGPWTRMDESFKDILADDDEVAKELVEAELDGWTDPCAS
jgi:hypothetical protein